MPDNDFTPTLVGGQIADIPQVESLLLDAPWGQVLTVAANGHNGLETKVIDLVGEAPDAYLPRTVAPRTVTDQASFLAEATRRPLIEGISTVWANRKAGSVTVVYDELDGIANPVGYTRRADRLELRFIRSEDWKLFTTAADRAFHSQDAFGDLLQSVGHLITSHSAADLLEVVDSIRATSTGSFESRINRANGSQTLSYSEEVNATAGRHGQLEVPRGVEFRVSPFEDYPEFDISADLRLRVSGGKLAIGLFPEPFDHKIRDSWLDVTSSLSQALGVPVYAANL